MWFINAKSLISFNTTLNLRMLAIITDKWYLSNACQEYNNYYTF